MKILMTTFLVGLGLNITLFAQVRPVARDSSTIFYSVSLIQLIATPEKFNGKLVQVVGYLNIEFEGDAIYLHKEDFDNNLASNGLRINFNEGLYKEKELKEIKLVDYSKKYVIIKGVFMAYPLGSYNRFSGQINNITRLDSWRVHR